MSQGSLTAKDAANYLGIKVETLYAYVSRGLLTSQDQNKTRQKLYRKTDLDRLQQSSRTSRKTLQKLSSPISWGAPTFDTAVTKIIETTPHYRGNSLEKLLSYNLNFENICELLWSGTLELSPIHWESGKTKSLIHSLPTNSYPDFHHYAVKLTMFFIHEFALTTKSPNSGTNDYHLAKHLLHYISQQISHLRSQKPNTKQPTKTIAEALTVSLGTTANRESIINQLLIICADYGLSSTTFVARIAASTGADLFSCLTAATGALYEPQRGATFAKIETLTQQFQDEKSVQKLAKLNHDSTGDIPGFYAEGIGDKRAQLILQLAATLPKSKSTNLIDHYLQIGQENFSQVPQVELALVRICEGLKLPKGSASAIFLISRISGWCAHVFEQRQSGFSFAPSQRYFGR